MSQNKVADSRQGSKKLIDESMLRQSSPQKKTKEQLLQQKIDNHPGGIKLKRKRKQISCIFYWGNVMAILLMSYMNFLIFFVENVMIYSIIIGMIVIMSSMIFIIGSCKMAATFRDWIWLYFLLDSIMVSVCTCLIGYAGMLTIMLPPEIYAYIVAAAMNMNFFFFAGSSRVIVVYGIMKRWETLMYKMAIKVSLLGYLILAAYFMSNDIGAALGLDDEKGNVLEQFFFLYIFGLFTLYMDIFSKISDIDGSSSLQYHFRLDDQENLLEVDLIPSDEKVETEESGQKKNGQPFIGQIVIE